MASRFGGVPSSSLCPWTPFLMPARGCDGGYKQVAGQDTFLASLDKMNMRLIPP